MRCEEARQRIASLPDRLPAPADILMPVVLDAPAGASRGGDRSTLGGRPAAVLVLLFPDDRDDARLVLIERATHDGHHSGEVSFPGGKAEPEDVDAVATAMREATEEVGLDPDAAGVTVVGRLDEFLIPVSDFRVRPIVAIADRTPAFIPDAREVRRIVIPPVDTFLPEAPIRMIERTIDGWSLRYGAYDVERLSVWGATARVLSQLGGILHLDR